MSIPITLTDVEVYCRTIKSIHPEKKHISTTELFDGMHALEAWKKVTPDSIFVKVLNESPYLKDE